jgi:hypothetical protein
MTEIEKLQKQVRTLSSILYKVLGKLSYDEDAKSDVSFQNRWDDMMEILTDVNSPKRGED